MQINDGIMIRNKKEAGQRVMRPNVLFFIRYEQLYIFDYDF